MTKPTTITTCVEVEAPRCPSCDSKRLRVYKTVGDQGDDTRLQFVFCRRCSHRFKVITV